MTLLDPLGGLPAAFGSILPSGHVSTVWNQQPRAVDGGAPVGNIYPGNVEFSGQHTHDGSILLDVGSTLTVNGDLDGTTEGGAINASLTGLTVGRVTLAGTTQGGVAWRTDTLPDSDTDLFVSKDEYLILVTTTGAPRVYTLRTSGIIPADGMSIWVSRTIAIGGVVSFRREAGAEIAVIPTTSMGMLRFTYHPAQNGWYVSMAGGGATVTVHT